MLRARLLPAAVWLVLTASLSGFASTPARTQTTGFPPPATADDAGAARAVPPTEPALASGGRAPAEDAGQTAATAPAVHSSALLHSSAALDSAGGWALLSDPDSPPLLRRPVAAYDPKRDRMLAIEGAYGSGWPPVYALDFEPAPHWSVLAASGPAPVGRVGPSLIYDPVRDRLLLFGGSGYNDVWALTLTGTPTWQPVFTGGDRPETRGGHSAVYDPVRDRMIVFGGVDNPTGSRVVYHDDTWAFSLTSNQWVPLAVSGDRPPARAWHRAVYDPGGDRMLIFGGRDPAGPRNDVWAMAFGDSSAWTALASAGVPPSPRYVFAMAYDSSRQRVLVHGGLAASGVTGDLWALWLSGAPVWEPVATEDSLEGRADHAMIYDPVRDQLVVYAGSDAVGSWDQCATLPLAGPLRWTRFLPPAPPVTPGPRSGHVVVYDSKRGRLLAFGGSIRRSDVPLWAFTPEDSGLWTPIFTTGSAPVGPALYDSVSDRMLIFSGSNTWALALEPTPAWSLLDSSAPPNLAGASFTYDPLRHRVVVYGGTAYYPHADISTLRDVWALDLEGAPSWTRLGAGPVPYGSAGHSAFYDPVRDRLVVVGGYWQSGSTIKHSYRNAIWATSLNGPLSWTTFPVAGPAPPSGQPLYDPARDRILLFGLYGGVSVWSVWSRPAADSGQWSMLGSVGAGPLAASPVVLDPGRDRAVMLFTGPSGAVTDQAWALIFGVLEVTLERARATPDAVELVWRSPLARDRSAVVERRETVGEWARIAVVKFDATGRAFVSDHDVRPGARYAYRLGLADGDTVRFTDPVWMDVPDRPAFALLGARPNPAVGTLVVSFTLPDAAPATLALFDVIGRRRWSRDVASLGTGQHLVPLDAREVPPGLYFLRLTRGGESRSARCVIAR